MNKLDIGNFMGVIGATVQDEQGLRFSGAHMPSGKDVVAPGAKLSDLMTNREMAQTWYDTIRSTHEREKKEADHASSTADTPDLVIRGEDGPAAEPRGVEAPTEVRIPTFEEELQDRYARWDTVVLDLEPRLALAMMEREKVLTAMEALSISPGDS